MSPTQKSYLRVHSENPFLLQIAVKSKSTTISLSAEVRNEIMKSREEIKKGHFIENDILEKEIEEWLSQK